MLAKKKVKAKLQLKKKHNSTSELIDNSRTVFGQSGFFVFVG